MTQWTGIQTMKRVRFEIFLMVGFLLQNQSQCLILTIQQPLLTVLFCHCAVLCAKLVYRINRLYIDILILQKNHTV